MFQNVAASRTLPFVSEFITFGIKQAWACIFGGVFLFFIIATHYYYPLGAYIHRYDFLFFIAIATQILLLAFRLENFSEAAVIILFHIVATGMEVFKTSDAIGSWIYPEQAVFKIGNVPLFAGFMYSAVGSYITRSWKVFHFRFSVYPHIAATCLLAAGIGWLLVALFIWFAENVGTYTHTWLYPAQTLHWTIVSPHKIVAWYMVIIISFILVSLVHSRSVLQQRG